MKRINVAIHETGSLKKIVHLSLNSPQNLNAFDLAFYEELKTSLDNIANDEDTGVLVLSSNLTKAFSTGVDVKYIQTLTNQAASLFFQNVSNLLEQLVCFPVPTIAIINGYAYGAGADLAISCDLRVASTTTEFRFPGPKFGLILGTKRLINEIGPSRARFLTLSGTKVKAATAQHYGLVHRVCEEAQEAYDTALNWSNTLLKMPADTAGALKELCTGDKESSSNLTRDSVLQGDFQERFHRYLEKTN
ncbi:enoyl-CoA hydratase/isomerase family protein [Domibacillus sp. DTU_2020_1001157_1_SI_ALB_TIR_016]|uniref:enoyl-CoA hydratase/isomerase family protein n=1 Tax=Domibacillus sp. DTU_2020_1001157_1_SI_ALB_TIR_016 TaxID=3077789 RepID=UPI0028EC4577|nr:enoyl-CoA hydratase/isomerase family protein [Domibacillus sp. DTU_2020_1001157_1_SI_ALB_TIR_016]WNS78354.1 enoyl-CoA hydratase/isomerase family protein [Domibacillus sp. DTU_2020_1001157_1_SI_ALB_TIR_016]